MANVAIEYDFGVCQKHRFESFCYGPKNCKMYKMGRARAVPYKGRGSALDEGWLDEIMEGIYIYRYQNAEDGDVIVEEITETGKYNRVAAEYKKK